MHNRFKRLYLLPVQNLYLEGAPLLLCAGALLEDTEKGALLVQLKFKNLSDQVLQAIKVSIETFDSFGKPLEQIPEYQYLDLNAARDEEFGQNVGVILHQSSARRFTCRCTAVAFDDGTQWTASELCDWQPLAKQLPLAEHLGVLAEQYRLDIGVSTFSIHSVPTIDRDLWLCACGAVNHTAEPTCHRCKKAYAALAAALDTQHLQEHLLARQQAETDRKAREQQKTEEKRAAAEAERQKNAGIARRKRKKRNLILAATFLVILAAALPFFIFSNAITYTKATKLLEKEDYQNAITCFEKTTGYKNSDALLDECMVLQLMQEDRYQEALSLFQSLDTFPTATERIEKNVFDYATQLESAGKTAEAAIYLYNFSNDHSFREKSLSLWKKTISTTSLDASRHITVGLKTDGTVVTTGYNQFGNSNVQHWKDIVSVSAGWYHTIGLKKDGTVIATSLPYNTFDPTRRVSDWRNIVSVSVSGTSVAGLRADGTIVAVTTDGRTPHFTQWRDMVAVSCGYNFIAGLKADGSPCILQSSSAVSHSSVRYWNNIVSISAGSNHLVGLKADGTVIATGSNDSKQCAVKDWKNIVAISAGAHHTVGLCSDGTVVATGKNWDGCCNVSNWEDIVAISAGRYHTVAQKKDGKILTVGENSSDITTVSSWEDIALPRDN